MGHHQVARQPTDPWAIARRRARRRGKHPGGDLPAGARSPLDPMRTHPQPHLGQIEHLPGLHPSNRRQRQIPTTATTPDRPVDNHLVRVGHLGQYAPGAPGCLPGARPPPRRCCRRAGGLPSPSHDGGREALEESLPRRRSSSATRALRLAIRLACSALAATSLALAWRNCSITIACTATVASRSGEEITASWTPSGHAPLPMGLWDSYRTPPQQVNPPTVRLNQSPEWLRPRNVPPNSSQLC
jgi:hypothetical protein